MIDFEECPRGCQKRLKNPLEEWLKAIALGGDRLDGRFVGGL